MGRTIVMPATVAKHLREGLLVEMGDAAEQLAELTLAGAPLTHEVAYRSALWRIEATRSLLARVGVMPPMAQRPIELDLNEYPLILTAVLKSQQLADKQRVQDAKAEGLTRAPTEDRALSEFVAILEEAMSRSAKAKRERRFSGSLRAERILTGSTLRSRTHH